MIYDPLEEFNKKYASEHLKNTTDFFDKLVKQSNVNIEENRKTVKLYHKCKDNLKKLKRKYNWYRFLRVIMIITIILIPLVIWKTTPRIKELRQEIAEIDKKVAELLQEAYNQMAPLNRLFEDRDALNLIEATIPMLNFAPYFSAEQEMNMIVNYDFQGYDDVEQSTLELLSGEYNGNPFLFENKLIHTMGTQVYHGYKTIYWTETYIDSEGETRTRTQSQTLHATVIKPKPYYSTQVVLNYGAQGGADLSFTRDATHLEQKSERSLERHIKKGKKKIKRKTDKAIKENDDFIGMSNTEFEVLFDALDRTNEVQYRTLFTPLAQTNMVSLILSKEHYGDDFNFIKNKRMNQIIANHSQGREINILANEYHSYSFDIIKDNFMSKNTQFFKDVYFDFAPLWAIPIYQERPVHSLDPLPDYDRLYSQKECESLANRIDYKYVVHPNSKTQAILKTYFMGCENEIETTRVIAYSYDIEPRVDVVPMWGRDGNCHAVPVPWDEYIPLENGDNFYITKYDNVKNKDVIAAQNDLCIFN